MALDLIGDIKALNKPRAKPGAKAPPGQVAPTQTSVPSTKAQDSPAKAAIKRVQQVLIDNDLTVRNQEPQFADGGWGPLSNESLFDLIEGLTGEGGHYSPSEEEVAAGKQLQQYWDEDPKITVSKISQILQILQQNPEVLGSKAKENLESGTVHEEFQPPEESAPAMAKNIDPAQQAATPKDNAGGRPQPKERAPAFWTVSITGSPDGRFNKTYSNVLIDTQTLANAANLQELLVYKGMIDPNSRGQARAEQIMAAVAGIVEALPPKFEAARYHAEMLGRELQEYALKQGKQVHVRQYLNDKFGEELFKMTEPMKQSALHSAEQMLRRKNILDEDGYLKHQSAAEPYTIELERLFEGYLRRIGT